METYQVFLALGALLLVGLLSDTIGRRTPVPRVTLLILFGFAAGQSGLDLIPAIFHSWYDFLATIALTMVAFLLGGQLSVQSLQENGREIVVVSVVVVAATIVIVATGLLLLGVPVISALLFSGIATATAPAATQDVVRQTKSKGRFSRTLLGIVAIDDAWGLIVFSILLVVAKAVSGDGGALILQSAFWEIGGALAIGLLIGLPAAFLTGRLQDGEPIQSEALGIVFLCAGLAEWLDVSFLLAGIFTGCIVVNMASHHKRPFHEIEQIEWPFLVLFFILAGAVLDINSLQGIGAIGLAYILLRFVSRLVGGWLGATLAGAPDSHRRWIGVALTPQAGVALGMALVAGQHFPELRESIIALVIGSTIIFEIIGPVFTQLALNRVGANETENS